MRASSRRVRSRRFGTCPHFELGAALPFLLFECSTHLTLEMWPPGRREAGDYLFAKSPPSRSRQRTWVPPRGRGPARSSRCRAPDGSTPCDSALALCRLQPRPNIRTLRHRRHHALVLLRIGDAVGTTPSASPKPRRLMSNSEAAASARGISCYCCCSRTAARTHRTSLCRATHRTSLCRAGSWIQMVRGGWLRNGRAAACLRATRWRYRCQLDRWPRTARSCRQLPLGRSERSRTALRSRSTSAISALLFGSSRRWRLSPSTIRQCDRVFRAGRRAVTAANRVRAAEL